MEALAHLTVIALPVLPSATPIPPSTIRTPPNKRRVEQDLGSKARTHRTSDKVHTQSQLRISHLFLPTFPCPPQRHWNRKTLVLISTVLRRRRLRTNRVSPIPHPLPPCNNTCSISNLSSIISRRNCQHSRRSTHRLLNKRTLYSKRYLSRSSITSKTLKLPPTRVHLSFLPRVRFAAKAQICIRTRICISVLIA